MRKTQEEETFTVNNCHDYDKISFNSDAWWNYTVLVIIHSKSIKNNKWITQDFQ